jgi:hypothetical protein
MMKNTLFFCERENSIDIMQDFIDEYGHEAERSKTNNRAYLIENTQASDNYTLVDQLKLFSKKEDYIGLSFFIEMHSINEKLSSNCIRVRNGIEQKQEFNLEYKERFADKPKDLYAPVLHEGSAASKYESSRKSNGKGSIMHSRRNKSKKKDDISSNHVSHKFQTREKNKRTNVSLEDSNIDIQQASKSPLITMKKNRKFN